MCPFVLPCPAIIFYSLAVSFRPFIWSGCSVYVTAVILASYALRQCASLYTAVREDGPDVPRATLLHNCVGVFLRANPTFDKCDRRENTGSVGCTLRILNTFRHPIHHSSESSGTPPGYHRRRKCRHPQCHVKAM